MHIATFEIEMNKKFKSYNREIWLWSCRLDLITRTFPMDVPSLQVYLMAISIFE